MPANSEKSTHCPVLRSIQPGLDQVAAGDAVANELLDPDALLLQLSSEEKIQLLSGDDMWHTVPIRRLGIPRVRVRIPDTGKVVSFAVRVDI